MGCVYQKEKTIQQINQLQGRKYLQSQKVKKPIQQVVPIKEEVIEDDGVFIDQLQIQDDVVNMVSSQQAAEYPYNCIGLLIGKDQVKGTNGYGTGFLIAPDLVVTVAHNLYFRRANQILRFSDFTFYPGQSSSQPYKCGLSFDDDKFKFHEGFTLDKGIDFDYAVMKLSEKVKRKKYLKIGLNYIDKNRADEELHLYGYRAEDCNSNRTAVMKGMFKKGTHQVNKISLSYSISTKYGNSGSPVLLKKGQDFLVVAIHKGALQKSKVNKGRIITTDVFHNFKKWEHNLTNYSKITYQNFDKRRHFQYRYEEIAFEQFQTEKQKNHKLKQTLLKLKTSTLDNPEIETLLKSSTKNNNNNGLKLKQLQKQLQKMQKQFKDHVNIDKKIKQTQQDIQMLEHDLKYNQITNEAIKLQKRIDILVARKAEKDKQVIKLQSQVKQTDGLIYDLLNSQDRSYQVQWDDQTFYSHHFHIENKKVTRITEGQPYQIISLRPLTRFAYTKIYFKLCKYGPNKKNIIFGITTSTRKYQKYSGTHLQSVGYMLNCQSKEGAIYVDSQNMQKWNSELMLKQGDQLEMRIDTIKYEIMFINKSKKLTFKLTYQHWKKKEIYVFVSLTGKDQSFEISN